MRLISIFILLISVLKAQNSSDPLLEKDFKGQLKWIDSVYNTMNIDEKIGQLFMIRISSALGQNSFDTEDHN